MQVMGEGTMAALLKSDRIAPVQKVGKAEFARFVDACTQPRQPSATLRESVATAGQRKR